MLRKQTIVVRVTKGDRFAECKAQYHQRRATPDERRAASKQKLEVKQYGNLRMKPAQC
jgi:hypothetical protein